jgi:hypothetical protein
MAAADAVSDEDMKAFAVLLGGSATIVRRLRFSAARAARLASPDAALACAQITAVLSLVIGSNLFVKNIVN